MLKQLSRLERTRSLIIVFFAIIMAVSLIAFYAPGRGSSGVDLSKSTTVAARVGSDKITVGDLVERKEQVMQSFQRFGGQLNFGMLSQLTDERRLLDSMIRERVIAQEAARLNLSASDAEVAAEIRQQFRDPATGTVNMERYKQAVTAQYGSVERFERQVRDQISRQKLMAYVTAGVRVSDEEVEDQYKRENTTFDLTYVTVEADKLAPKIDLSDDELRAYFKAHETDFRFLEPQKKIRYLYIDQAKVGEKLQISDEDLRKEYDGLAPENKLAGVKVQQIVLKVARPDLDAQVKAKADDLVKQLRGRAQEGKVPEEAFAEVARGNSEDPATAKNGGWLAGLVRKNPNKPTDPLQQTLDMQPGAISDPIKYGNAYYIFRRGEAVPKSFEDAKKELLVSLRNRRSYAAAAQLAQRAAERVKETRDIQKVAQEFAAEANMTPAEMVRETPYVKPGDDVKDIGSSPQFEEAIKPLEQPNDVGSRVAIKGGFAIPLLVDKKEPRIPDFEEVRDKVLKAARQDRAKQQLEQTAREIAAASAPADLKAAAEKFGLQAQTQDGYRIGSPLGAAGRSPALDAAIYGLKAGELTKTPIKVGDHYVVVGVTKRTEADLAEFAKQRESLTESALALRRQQVFEDYIAAAEERMRREGRIKINNDALAQLRGEEEPPAAAPRPGGSAPSSR
jgi:peptidyl-prolyl cis-trans isomerase D